MNDNALAVEVARLWQEQERLEGGLRTLSEGLAGAVATRKDVDRLESQLGELGSALDALTDALVDSSPDPEPPPRALWWPDLHGAHRRAAWDDLAGWLDGVIYVRHPDEYRRLQRCWYRHPAVVDELAALQVAWLAVYRSGKTPQPTAALEWYDRWLPGVMTRVSRLLGSCKQGHEDSPHGAGISGDLELQQFIEHDVRRHP